MLQSSKLIVNIAEHYGCSKVVIEDLKFKGKSDNKGKRFNRLTKNVWHRNILIQNLTRRCEDKNIELVKVNPAYSSFIGNIIWGSETCPDMIAASVEIARRGYKKYSKNWFYPMILTSYLKKQWKQDLNNVDVSTWIKLYKKLIKMKVKYRFALGENLEFFRNSSHKSKCNRFIFI